MTAVQDWLRNPPINPRSITSLICDALRGQRTDDPEPPADPPLLERGLERC